MTRFPSIHKSTSTNTLSFGLYFATTLYELRSLNKGHHQWSQQTWQVCGLFNASPSSSARQSLKDLQGWPQSFLWRYWFLCLTQLPNPTQIPGPSLIIAPNLIASLNATFMPKVNGMPMPLGLCFCIYDSKGGMPGLVLPKKDGSVRMTDGIHEFKKRTEQTLFP